jgi:hypothetical protein
MRDRASVWRSVAAAGARRRACSRDPCSDEAVANPLAPDRASRSRRQHRHSRCRTMDSRSGTGSPRRPRASIERRRRLWPRTSIARHGGSGALLIA